MPTEELFGAYHFLLEVAGAPPKDSFEFTAEGEAQQTAIITPAVQLVSQRDLEEALYGWARDEGPGLSASEVYRDNDLRSDGDLVQAVADDTATSPPRIPLKVFECPDDIGAHDLTAGPGFSDFMF